MLLYRKGGGLFVLTALDLRTLCLIAAAKKTCLVADADTPSALRKRTVALSAL